MSTGDNKQKDKKQPDKAMLALFCTEAVNHVNILNQALDCLHKNTCDENAVASARNALKTLSGTSRLVNLNDLAELTLIMEAWLATLARQPQHKQPEYLDTLETPVALLKEVSEVDADKIGDWLARQGERINQVTLVLAEQLNRHQESDTADHKEPDTATDTTGQKPVTAGKKKNARKKSLAKKKTAKKKTAKKKTAKKQAAKKRSTKKATAKKTGSKKTASQIRGVTAGIEPDESMLNLFRLETETNTTQLSRDLLELERNPDDTARLEAMMRASHSVKGAARMVNIDCAVKIAHALEDVFVAAQKNELKLGNNHIDVLLRAVDVLQTIADLDANAHDSWSKGNPMFNKLLDALNRILSGKMIEADIPAPVDTSPVPAPEPSRNDKPVPDQDGDNRILRISTRRINKMMGLSGELVVNSGWIRNHADSLLMIKRKQAELVNIIDRLRDTIELTQGNEQISSLLDETEDKANQCRQLLASRLSEVDDFDRRAASLATRLNHEVLASRMRPFEDGIQGFDRMARDLARDLGKEVDLQFEGLDTQVDRDILESLEAPLTQLIRNAVDHGIELPEARRIQGKPARGAIQVRARHASGLLSITVSDDGRGVDLDKLRDMVLERHLVNPAMANNLSSVELLNFLFLPGFTTRSEVTEISGRGVGLDVVQNMIQEIRGTVHARTSPGNGLQIEMQLPLTQSVMRCLMVSISGEPYAFPLARVGSVMSITRDQIQVMEDRQYISVDNQLVGLVDAAQVLETGTTSIKSDQLHVVIMGDHLATYGMVVEDSLGERGLALRAIDPRLGKIRNISASAILDDGTPVLVVDTEDMLRSIENLVTGKRLHKVREAARQQSTQAKRVLVVDDSLTVREVERKLLESHGYKVDVAVDGMDGWNSVRTVDYDLVVTDIDMPRMNGIEFVEMIKADSRLQDIPVMIVSYKDRPEDHRLGLEVGADYYLTKGSFHDDSLVDAVIDLIGEAE